jgi:hypothetical protein
MESSLRRKKVPYVDFSSAYIASIFCFCVCYYNQISSSTGRYILVLPFIRSVYFRK